MSETFGKDSEDCTCFKPEFGGGGGGGEERIISKVKIYIV